MTPTFSKSALTFVLLVTWAVTYVLCSELKDEAPCDSPIFCNGPLLSAVQDAHVFNDSKTFVDLHMKQSEATILEAFANLEDPTNRTLMEAFVEEFFDGPNTEFTAWNPSDWTENPRFLDKIADQDLLVWARDLNQLWKELGRQITDNVSTSSDRYSMMYVENPFIIPGGRFREFYYWDSYWIFKGLLLCEMRETVKGMLSNFVDTTKILGHVPNGNRIYYEKRSQPPFLIPSVLLYAKTTSDMTTVTNWLPDLEDEYAFWMNERAVNVTKAGSTTETFTLNRYNVFMGMPRPESYREDVETAAGLNEEDAAEVYSNLASAAESGWDFSSRWFGDRQSLSTIRTKQIVPVDLNSVLCLSEWALYELYNMTGDQEKAANYLQAYNARKEAIQAIMWSEDAGVWLDYDLESQSLVDEFYASNVMPMWAACYDADNIGVQQSVLDYLKREGVLDYAGGVPTSLINSGQQWDYPNAWPPLQDIVIDTLRNSDVQEAKDYALNLARNWTLTNWRAYRETDLMFEKYDVEKQGVPGHGGEYEVQAGFGWSNGVILTLLDQYGDVLAVGDGSTSWRESSRIILAVSLAITSFFIRYIS